MSGVNKKEFVSGTFWKVLERFASRGISLVISAVLARILFSEDYGLIALTTVFTNLSDILIDAGFGTALIRKDKVNDDDYSSVFFISLSISLLLYVIIFFVAPFAAAYYDQPQLTPVLRVMSLVLFVQAFSSTRNAYVNRNMLFKLQMKCNTVSSVVSGIVGIILAYCGYGVWALVFQRLVQQALVTILLLIKVKWKIRFKMNISNLKEMFHFSAGVIGASAINYVENCLNSLIIGKHYSVSDLGYYDKGNILPEQISLNSFGAMTNVLLPTIASHQNDLVRVRQIVRKVVNYTSFLVFPVMLGLLLTARESVIVLFSEKWISSIPLMQCICIYYIATPLMLIDIQVFFALGHSEIRVKTELFRMVFIILALVLCCFVFKLSIRYLAMFNAIAASLATIITHFEVTKLIGYTIRERIEDGYKSAISAGIMCIAILLFKRIPGVANIPALPCLLIQIVMGIIVYSLMSMLLKNSVFYEMVGKVKTVLRKRHE